jgi:hypothetical protein
MKQLLFRRPSSFKACSSFALCIVFTLITIAGCKHDPSEVQVTDSPGFDFKKAVGIWVPYEYVIDDTMVVPGPFTAMSIFGAYAESVEIKEDNTFAPTIWFDSSNIIKKEDEGGPVFYNKTANELHFDNPFHFRGLVRKFDGKYMWIETKFYVYRFKRMKG